MADGINFGYKSFLSFSSGRQGQPVFSGTRVPVESLFDHLESGVSLDEFLAEFPGVKRQQAVDLLEAANKFLTVNFQLKVYQ